MPASLPEPGDIVAEKYVIERLLGRGGMGVVYVVTHRTTAKRLALKCLLPEFVGHPPLVERFLREAQAAGRIEHRHVVDVFDAGRDGSTLYIVMALLEGMLLTALLKDETLTLEETMGILVRAMDGVAAAHALGIIHRDLKPDNIFVCVGPSGRLDDPRVLDFGISKLEDDASYTLTQSGMMMGSPYYMSFEQMNSQRDLDQRVDIYAIGVILYEALSGQHPYVAESAAALAIQMLTQPPQHLAALRPDLPRALCEVVMKTIARDRDDRYPTMRALIDAIRPFAPAGAGSLVAEGQGTPLRTSRVSQLQAPGTRATETPPPKAQELRRTHQPERAPLQLSIDREPAGRRRSEGSRGVGVTAWLSLLACGLGVGFWWLSSEPPEARRAQTHAAPPRAPAATADLGSTRPPAAQAPQQTSADVGTPLLDAALSESDVSPKRNGAALSESDPSPKRKVKKRTSRKRVTRKAGGQRPAAEPVPVEADDADLDPEEESVTPATDEPAAPPVQPAPTPEDVTTPGSESDGGRSPPVPVE